MINKKALWVFLVLTFGLTITLVFIARAKGFTLVDRPLFMSQMVVLVAMFIPALSALFTQKFISKKPIKEMGLKWGSGKMYAKAYGLISLMFIVNYAITWIFFLSPDWTLTAFLNQYAPGMSLPVSAGKMIFLFALITFIAAPIFNIIPSLGEEIGWRGFLLPNLEPLGKIKAMILSGVIWALWHTPMILFLGFLYGKQIWPGVLLHFFMVAGIGIWMGYIWFKTRSTILAAFIHATFNANAYGFWTMVFVSQSKLIVGAAGLIGASLCVLLGIFSIYFASRKDWIKTLPSF